MAFCCVSVLVWCGVVWFHMIILTFRSLTLTVAVVNMVTGIPVNIEFAIILF